jgi:hypothetical protein
VTINQIPLMDDPLGRHWNQPAGLRDRVLIDDTHAVIAETDFLALPEYSSTIPSGVYPGKAWRRHDGAHARDGKPAVWMLCWYGPDVGGRCAIEHRTALML